MENASVGTEGGNLISPPPLRMRKLLSRITAEASVCTDCCK